MQSKDNCRPISNMSISVLPKIQFRGTEERLEHLYTSSSTTMKSQERSCQSEFVKSSSLSDVLRQMPAEHWLLSLRPPSKKAQAKQRAIELWTRQELAKVTSSQKEKMSNTWCLGGSRDAEDYALKTIPLPKENSEANKPPDKGSGIGASLTETNITMEKTNDHSRMISVKSLKAEHNGNNVYNKDDTNPETLQSSVDAPDGDTTSLSLNLTNEEHLLEGETELPDNKLCYAKSRPNLPQHHRGDAGASLASSALALNKNLVPKTSHRLLKRLGSLTATPSLIQGWGVKAPYGTYNEALNVRGVLPKADSEIISRIKSSSLELSSNLQAKAASDVVVSNRPTSADNNIQTQTAKIKKMKKPKRFPTRTSLSQLHPTIEEKEMSRPAENSGKSQSRDHHLRTPSRINKLLPFTSSVMMVDYRRSSSLVQNNPKRDEEDQRSIMKNALLSVFEYDMSGHRQSKVVLTSRLPKKTPNKENSPTNTRVRRTRRFTTKTVAASPSVIANLWRQVDKNRLRRRMEQHGISKSRALPKQAGNARVSTIACFNSGGQNQGGRISNRRLKLNLQPWSPHPILEIDEDESDIISMDKSKSKSEDQTHPSRHVIVLGSCRGGEKKVRGKASNALGRVKLDLDAKSPDTAKTTPEKMSSRNEIKTGQRIKASPGKIERNTFKSISNMSMNKPIVRADMGARGIAVKRKSRKKNPTVTPASSKKISAIGKPLPQRPSPNQRSGNLTSDKPARVPRSSQIPTRGHKPVTRFKTTVSRKSRRSPELVKEEIKCVAISETHRQSSQPGQRAIRRKRNKKRAPPGRNKVLPSLKPSEVPRDHSKQRQTGVYSPGLKFSSRKTERKARFPTKPCLPANSLASASDTHINQATAVTRLSPVLCGNQAVTSGQLDAGDQTISSLTMSTDTIASTTLGYEKFPSALVEAERHRGSPLKRFGASLSTHFQFRKISRAPQMYGTKT
ncbi:hypothetical protein EGW08_011301 [Elysia chlorotica]|uniref:Uncharacterized protein n=1 Tax=Elysia chlorotica TaxID=188477 RepID=A0A3S1C290_ELYCH|nr:hypothetical protein EGW08_011301 [Elysia chlorotica]